MPDSISPPVVLPANSAGGRSPERRAGRGCLLPFVLVVLAFSLLVNLGLFVFVFQFAAESFDVEDAEMREQFYLGEKDASDKVAIVKVEGVISEAGIAHPLKQLEAAARDKHVKAVVLRIDSPGGSVSASEELYQNIVNLRDDNGRRFKASGPKPVAVSMGPLAASGGYYIAAAGSPIYAERTTITGSIGVFAALPNVADLANRNGVKVELIKAGGIKASGSFFHDMSQEERQTWQDTVDSAYDTFLGVIEKGRPNLTKEKLSKEEVIARDVPVRDSKGNVEPSEKDGKRKTIRYTRVRADGGTYTAEQAKQFGLIDEVADLPAAVKAAAQKAGLSPFRAVAYSKPPSLLHALTGMKAEQQLGPLDPVRIRSALTPRLWYLAPDADGVMLTGG